MKFLDETLTWATYAQSYDKIGFVKSFLNCLGVKEIKKLQSIISHVKSKKETKARSWTGPIPEEINIQAEGQKRSREKATCIPVETVKPPEKAVNSPVETTKPPAKAVNSPVETVKPPAKTVTSPARTLEELKKLTFQERMELAPYKPGDAMVFPKESYECKWWKAFMKSDYVSFDVECVNMFEGYKSEKERAGIIGAVDCRGRELLNTMVYREANSFETDTIGAKISGITDPYALVDGEPEEEVQKKMDIILKNKISIMVAAEKDFRMTGLPNNMYYFFDLQSFYRRPAAGLHCATSTAMSLRDIYFFHLKKIFSHRESLIVPLAMQKQQ